jgi:hypothetical protein
MSQQQQRPKFAPQETPLSNYNKGVIAWSYFTLAFDSPLGPKTGKYDPYYIYSVGVQMGDQVIDHVWFATIEDHIRIQIAGGTKGSIMKASYIKDQKKRALVIQHTGGPVVQRIEASVRAEVEAAIDAVNNIQDMNQDPGSSWDDDNLVYAPGGHQEARGIGVSTNLAPDPFASPVPTTPPPPPQRISVPIPSPSPPPPPAVPFVAGLRGVESYTGNQNNRNYQPFNDQEKAAWKARFSDIAELQLFAYAAILDRAKELDVKVKASDQRELATSVSIQTWREFSAKGGLYGWTFIPPVVPLTADTKEHALEKINAYIQDDYPDKNTFIKTWLADVAEPVDALRTWKHAANIANLLGIDSQVIYDEFDVDAMMLIAQVMWAYSDARDEGMTTNESLSAIAQEFGLPEEEMKFEAEDE